MANMGFNIKVRKVSNGYTVHINRTGVPPADDDHEDFVALDSDALKELLETEIDMNVNLLEEVT